MSGSNDLEDLSEVFEQCLALGGKEHQRAIFTQLVVVGCVRAGLTRLDKRLVFVFDLKSVTMIEFFSMLMRIYLVSPQVSQKR